MWDQILGQFGDVIFDKFLPPVLLALATALTAVVVKGLQKLNIDVDEERKAALRKLIQDAIQAAEEWGRRHIEATGQAKRDKAIEFAQAVNPKLDREDATKMIDSQLPVVRAKLATPFPPVAGG